MAPECGHLTHAGPRYWSRMRVRREECLRVAERWSKNVDLGLAAFPQATPFTCGPAAVRTLLTFLGLKTPSEAALAVALKTLTPTSPKGPGGTRPESIVRY